METSDELWTKPAMMQNSPENMYKQNDSDWEHHENMAVCQNQ
jgi:hypothetical protein